MAHHKRRRPKAQRNGCTCKWWKFEGNALKVRPLADRRQLARATEE